MFQHMVTLLDQSQLEQVKLCMNLFHFDKEVRQQILRFPKFK